MTQHLTAVILQKAADLCELGWTRHGMTAIRGEKIRYSADGALYAASNRSAEDFSRAALYLRNAIRTHDITIWNGRWWRRRATVVKALRNAAVAAWRAGE